MFARALVATALALGLAAPASAERHSDCPIHERAAGVPPEATPNVRTRFIAPPRLIGGDVACLLVAVPGGYSRFVSEIIPGQDGRFAMIHGHLGVTLRDLGDGGPGRDVARCARPEDAPLFCWVDLSGTGGGLRLIHDADLEVMGVSHQPDLLPGQVLGLAVPDASAVLDLADFTNPQAVADFATALGDGRHGLLMLRDGARDIGVSGDTLRADLSMARRFFAILLPEVLPR